MYNTKSVSEVEISAVIHRADGTVEDLGVIAEYKAKKPNIFERLVNFFKKLF
jgi:hypothetical protein